MHSRTTYSFIYNLQRNIMLVCYVTTSIALCVALAKLMIKLSPGELFPLVGVLLVYTIVVIILGSMIHVISYIPFHLSAAFDPIKNDIASGRIRSMEQLAGRITTFTVQFYNFSFLDITHAFIQTEGSEVMGHETNSQVEQVLKAYGVLERSQEFEQVTRAGKISLPDKDYHIYILPIWLGDQWLGYMALLSEKRINRFFQRFLMEYEENFLDDQIMHLVQRNKPQE
jgi:hypothetical protein